MTAEERRLAALAQFAELRNRYPTVLARLEREITKHQDRDGWWIIEQDGERVLDPMLYDNEMRPKNEVEAERFRQGLIDSALFDHDTSVRAGAAYRAYADDLRGQLGRPATARRRRP